jgi:thioesterase domain-containing protein
VEVAGRADAQVKLRGFRIEPGEVESALRAYPAVRDAAVVPHGEDDTRKLVAYLVASGAPPADEELREMMRGRLPDYTVPAAFVWLDALPLTPNGKLDRRALPDPQAPAEAGYVAPRTPTEQVLADAWAALLRVERVGATDDFFALGGHSLLATRVAARVRDAFGVELPLRAVFRSPMLAALAADIDARRGGGAPAAAAEGWLEPVEPGSTVHRFPSGQDAAGGQTPFFCVHPAGGTVLHYADLAYLIAPDRPLYALQAVGVYGEAEPLATVDEMAERYLADVRRVQPHGPYVLGGWSAGGVVALEMAERLRISGEEVGTVALFDTRPPDFGQQRRVVDSAELYRGYVESLVPADGDALSALESALRALPEGERLPHLSRWMAARDASVVAGEVERIGAAVRVFQATSAAARQHHVRPYAGRVDLFRAREGTAGEGVQAAGLPETWRALGLSALRVHDVPGTHTSMVLPPHVQPLATALRAALAAAEAPEADAVER